MCSLTPHTYFLSQGLRIAPPEAPVTGYMFGKGVYFADMVSKSANYCCTTRTNNTGLLLLCAVALGDMYERTQADYIEKLPKGKHSTKVSLSSKMSFLKLLFLVPSPTLILNSFQGVGKTSPDPSETTELDGAKVPFGPGVKADDVDTALLYNEFIVYDVAQVQSKYLFKMKFNYNV